MALAEQKMSIIGLDGNNAEIELSLETYQAAAKHNMSLGQYLNSKYRTNVKQNGTAMAQVCAAAGIFLTQNNEFGIRPPTVAELMNGGAAEAAINLGVVSRPNGSASDTPSGRLLFPAVLLEMVESSMRPNIETYMGAFNSMVSQTVNLSSQKYSQVRVDYSKARTSRSQPIAQLARPAQMLTFTLAERSANLPVYSIGIKMSDQAAEAMQIDFIAKVISEQQIWERSAKMTDDLVAIVTGDIDSNQTALSAITATSLDATLANVPGALSQDAWVMFLRNNWMTRSITDVVCDVKTYLSIEKRTGRVTAQNASATDERLNSVPRVVLPGIPSGVNIFLTEGSPLGANTMLGMDRSKALRRVVYVGAAYNAIEEFVMTRAKEMRMDWSERIESLGFSEAFQLMTLT